MKTIINTFNKNKNLIIRNSFLIPILLVVIISISHVVSWYNLGNPIKWAIYLSIAIEIFALSSISAATIKMNRTTIWFLFGLVTLIQIIGNIFFEYQYIDINSDVFLAWVELISPLFIDWDLIDHRRFLATVQGGTLPLMSLTALHFYIKFNDNIEEFESNEDNKDNIESIVEEDKPKESEIKPEEKNIPLVSDTIIPVKPMSENNSIDTFEKDNKHINEPIDEESIINNAENKTKSEIKLDSDTILAGNLDKLKEKDIEKEMRPVKNISERYKNKDGETFGPPNINNN